MKKKIKATNKRIGSSVLQCFRPEPSGSWFGLFVYG